MGLGWRVLVRKIWEGEDTERGEGVGGWRGRGRTEGVNGGGEDVYPWSP